MDLSDCEFVLQTGHFDFSKCEKLFGQYKGIQVLDFIQDMKSYLTWADLVISRAGASTIAELACLKKASILIPLPKLADDHQTKNAKRVLEKQAAELLLQRDLSPEVLKEKILYYKETLVRLKS